MFIVYMCLYDENVFEANQMRFIIAQNELEFVTI